MHQQDSRPRSTFFFALALAATIALIAAPTAPAAQPTVTVIAIPPFLVPAGSGCSFDVEGNPGESATIVRTEFSNGMTTNIAYANGILTNLETGDTFLQRSRAIFTVTPNPATNEIVRETFGRIFQSFEPGDQGPYGVVEEPGLALSVIGHQRIVRDATTSAIVSYTLDGTAIDVCAELSS